MKLETLITAGMIDSAVARYTESEDTHSLTNEVGKSNAAAAIAMCACLKFSEEPNLLNLQSGMMASFAQGIRLGLMLAEAAAKGEL
jgi:hypothetical protein